MLLAVLRTKGVVTGPPSGEKELWPVVRVQFPGGVGAERVGGGKAGSSQLWGWELKTERAEEEPQPRMEPEWSLEAASSQVQLCRVFTEQGPQAGGHVWMESPCGPLKPWRGTAPPG